MMNVTESESYYDHLEQMNTQELLTKINQEDHKVAAAVSKQLTNVAFFVEAAFECLSSEGRLFYIGAGTSGRLGVLDASECPPTFGVGEDQVVGIIAGGDSALRVAKEGAEDDIYLAWRELLSYEISEKDIVLGISSSGRTPYVLGGIAACKAAGIKTGVLVCNPESPLLEAADIAIEVVVGPEFISGSTRMKAGTAQKMVLNMISTCIMVKLGKVRGNKMVDMKLSNNKLRNRAKQMLIDELNITGEEAEGLLEIHGSVRIALDHAKNKGATKAT